MKFITRLRADEGGASAIEFALLAPLLVLACLATVDVGMGISQRMHIDQSLRAGAQGAMVGLGEAEVKALVENTAGGGFTIADEADQGQIDTAATDLAISVDRFCACPEDSSTNVNCDTGTCDDDAEPSVYYRLTAETEYDSLLLPQFPLEGSLLVQVE